MMRKIVHFVQQRKLFCWSASTYSVYSVTFSATVASTCSTDCLRAVASLIRRLKICLDYGKVAYR